MCCEWMRTPLFFIFYISSTELHSTMHTQAAFLASVWPTCLCLQSTLAMFFSQQCTQAVCSAVCSAQKQCAVCSVQCTVYSAHKQCAVCCAVWHNFVHSVRLSSGSTLWSQMGCMRLFRPPSQYWGILSKRDHRLILCTVAKARIQRATPSVQCNRAKSLVQSRWAVTSRLIETSFSRSKLDD